MESALTVKGQATIPKAIRDHLQVKAGDRIKFFLHTDGSVVLLPKIPTAKLKGLLSGRRSRPSTVEEMKTAITDGAAECHRGTKRT